MRSSCGQDQAPLPSIQLLGRFRLSVSGSDVATLGRKARGILAYLALSPRRCATREQLAGLLWSDRGSDQARASLRQALKELRELPAIREAISTQRDVVCLDEAAYSIDLVAIQKAAAARDLAALAELLEEVRGDLVEDLADLSPAFDEWIQGERPRQHDLVVADSLEAVEVSGLADAKDSRSILRSLDRLEPVSEAVARLGMRLDHAVGDRASLHRRYRQLCDRLKSEFGAPPSEETRGLFHSLAAERGTPPAPRVRNPTCEEATGVTRSVGGDLVPLVIVTPLEVSTGDGPLASLSAFAAADIRASISRMRGLRVLSVDQQDVVEILQRSDDALGVYLLSGTLRRFGAEYRASIQLCDAASNIIVWSDSLRLGDVEGSVLDAIVAKAAGAVVPAIDRDLDRRLRQPFRELTDERTMYTRARLLIASRRGLPEVGDGVRLLEKIVAANPQHLGAHLLLTRMYDCDFWQQLAGHDVAHFRLLAERHAQAAAAIEPGHYAVRARLAWRLVRKGKAQAALREFQAVLAHLPNDADVTNQCAMGFCFIGELDRAEELMRRAFFLNPFPSSDYHADLASVLALAGEPEPAEEHFSVSGETGLMYTAVRLANAAHLDHTAEWVGELLEHFAGKFQQAWQPDREPTLSDVLEWASYTLPLARPDHMVWLTGGLRQMLKRSSIIVTGSHS